MPVYIDMPHSFYWLYSILRMTAFFLSLTSLFLGGHFFFFLPLWAMAQGIMHLYTPVQIFFANISVVNIKGQKI